MSRPSKRPRSPNTPTAYAAWTDGNFEVLTSNNVLFKVPDYILFSSSAVFRDASGVASSSNRHLEFTDPDFETSAIFAFFLDVATTLTVNHMRAGFTLLSRVVPLLLFLRKWDCAPLQALVLRELKSWIPQGIVAPLAMFRVGAQVGETTLCTAVLRHEWSGATKDHDPWWISGSGHDYPFDPRGWPLKFWSENGLPPDYLFALVQATYGVPGRGSSRLADRFKKFLEAAGKASRVGNAPKSAT